MSPTVLGRLPRVLVALRGFFKPEGTRGLRVGRGDVDLATPENDVAVGDAIERVVAADADVEARLEGQAALARKDAAWPGNVG